MPTPAEIIDIAAPLMNDAKQLMYTDEACLPYLNIALRELRETFQENDIPLTNNVSTILTVTAGDTFLDYDTTTPVLPADLIDFQNIWESDTGQNQWFGPLAKRDFLPESLDGVQLSSFGLYAWRGGKLFFPALLQDKDLKFDYIGSIFTLPIEIEDIDVEMGEQFKNMETFLGYKTAALCSMYIGENETRAAALNGQAQEAIERALNIPTKGRQALMTRRRPFRASFKMRGRY